MGNKVFGLPQAKSHFTQVKTAVIPQTFDSKSKPASRTHSLKDRVIYMLALKPHTREHIVARLKKGMLSGLC